MKAITIRSIFMLVILTGILSCKKKKTVDQKAVDQDIIAKYLTDHQLTAKSNDDGLYWVINTQGTGVKPTVNSNVTVNYKGYLTNGTVFDQSPAGGSSFSLSAVIKGWQEGIPMFNKGGKGTLIIPSALGYGSTAQGSIPANSVLVFDITLIDVQ